MHGLSIEQRFWSKVAKAGHDDCWLWVGGRTQRGYGRLATGGRANRKINPAHRLAWTLTNGPIPEGMCVCHTCDNPPCCNPNHLFIGSQVDNIADMKRKGRARTHGTKGSAHACAKLTEEQVQEILDRHATGTVMQSELAAEYGVSRALINVIIKRKRWRHV